MDQQDGPRGRLTKEQADQMVVDVVGTHADSLLRVARRYSACPEDAQDAYQRALEVLVRRASTLDPDRVVGWIHTVVKHEAFAVRAKRTDLAAGDQDLEREESRTAASPEERIIDQERLVHTAEALQRLKPQELQALWHRALGKSYAEIADDLRWTPTKVNRCLVEGRKALATRFAGIESGAECERWTPVLSAMVDGEAGAAELAAVRPHLRNCAGCRAAVREMHAQGRAVAAVLPPVAVVAHEPSAGDAPGVLARAYESLVAFVGERAAVSAVKLQAATELVAGSKIAAVAASAAAVAGGGAVVADRTGDRDAAGLPSPTQRVVAAPARIQPAPRALAPVREALREARNVRSASPSGSRKRRRRAASGKEFGRRGASPAASGEFRRPATTAGPSREFAGAGSANTAITPAPASAPVSSSRSFESGSAAPERHPTTPTGPGRSRSGAEFGF